MLNKFYLKRTQSATNISELEKDLNNSKTHLTQLLNEVK